MTRQEAINLIISKINKAQDYKFDFVTIETIKCSNTKEVTGYYITSDFIAKHKNYTSNYSVKIIYYNDGSIFNL